MLGTVAAFALLWATAFPVQATVQDPVTYEAATAAQWGTVQTPAATEGSDEADGGAQGLTTEQQDLMDEDAYKKFLFSYKSCIVHIIEQGYS